MPATLSIVLILFPPEPQQLFRIVFHHTCSICLTSYVLNSYCNPTIRKASSGIPQHWRK